MKKKLLSLALVLSVLVPQMSVFADGGIFDFDEDKSILKVSYDSDDYTKFKLRITKDGSKYDYNLYDGEEVFPLQMGSGSYTAKLYERISGNKYRQIKSESEYVSLEENQVYLQSVQNINWSDKSKAIQLAKKLGLNKNTSEEKFKEIYNEIIKTIAYDYEKASTVTTRYLPVIDNTYLEKKGICYDYSSLMASMLRSLGIPTKMKHGYSRELNAQEGRQIYHAWNEVLLNNKWLVVDTTFDAGTNGALSPYKSSDEYQPSKEF